MSNHNKSCDTEADVIVMGMLTRNQEDPLQLLERWMHRQQVEQNQQSTVQLTYTALDIQCSWHTLHLTYIASCFITASSDEEQALLNLVVTT